MAKRERAAFEYVSTAELDRANLDTAAGVHRIRRSRFSSLWLVTYHRDYRQPTDLPLPPVQHEREPVQPGHFPSPSD